MPASPALVAAIEGLWRLRRPGPDNLLSAPEFAALSGICQTDYGGRKPVFALSNALRSLGLPCQLPADRAGLALDPAVAATMLDQAFRRTTVRRRHLCPLDLADELPSLHFGRAQLREYGAETLEAMFDGPRLARHFPGRSLEAARLAQFQWLMVEEEIVLEPDPEIRAAPFMYMLAKDDHGEIDPHLGRFPPAVETALFFLLLAPWEDWSRIVDIDWRGFRLPWIYTLDDDVFVAPAPPPSPDSLTLEPWIVPDGWGGEIEHERPTVLPLSDTATPGLARFTDAAWTEFEAALATDFFETPIAHFLVRAFLSEGIDEFMSHMTAIEAALGLEMDHNHKLRPKPDPYRKGPAPSGRVAARVAALLNDATAGEAYKELFALRSQFVHGRGGLGKISVVQRVTARRLARAIARGLIEMAGRTSQPRPEALSQLLDAGVPLLQTLEEPATTP